uniref:Si:ch211-215k15.4 n=1 Tax=Cyprinus carpio TaxID=7962 RepID=A0A8C1M6D8_CYPCA
RTMDMHVFFLLCILVINLALYGKATQSDLVQNPWSANGHAINAIDGNRDSNYEHGSCTATKLQDDPWWRLDLLDKYVVTSITITNRKDCCPERLDGAEIHIGNSLLNNGPERFHPFQVGGPSLSNGIKAFQAVTSPWSYLDLIDFLPSVRFLIQNYEFTWNPCIVLGENVALKGKATQISLYGNGFASSAIDGNKDAVYSHGSCTHTLNDLNPWWRLDLLKKHKVFLVVITNRVDAVPERLNGAEIRIGNSLDNDGNNNPRCAVISSIPPGFSKSYECAGMEGRYINVVIPGREEYLTLCEVEVHGSPLD